MITSSFVPNKDLLPYVVFNEQSGHHSLHAAQPYKKDEAIVSFGAGSIHSQATYLTIQLSDDRHISLEPSFLQYVNHSCVPNAFFDTTAMNFIALRDIEQDDELCFFYPSTEWKMAQAFSCQCGHGSCLEVIGGAYLLPKNIVSSYRLSEYILSKLGATR